MLSASSPESTLPTSQLEVSAPRLDQPVDNAFEARWAAWITRGRQHDLAVKRKFVNVLLAAAVVGLPAALYFGLAGGAR